MTYVFENPRTNSRATIWCMGIFCVLTTVGIVQIVQLNGMIRRILAATAAEDLAEVFRVVEEVERLDRVQSALSTAAVVVGIVSGIVFLRWTAVVAMNAHVLGSMTMTPRWAVCWHFVPFVNLWRPLQAMNEIVEESRPRNSDQSALTGWWWATHILVIVAFRIHWVMLSGAESTMARNPERGFDELLAANMAGIVTNVVLIACNVIACVMVARIERFQNEKYVQGGWSEESNTCSSCGEPLASSDIVCAMCGARRREAFSSLGDRVL